MRNGVSKLLKESSSVVGNGDRVCRPIRYFRKDFPLSAYSSFRDSFINYGCNTAVCSDGSDSVFLTYGEIFLEKAGYFKDSTQTIGIGFKSE
jgi:hypothetical protein